MLTLNLHVYCFDRSLDGALQFMQFKAQTKLPGAAGSMS